MVSNVLFSLWLLLVEERHRNLGNLGRVIFENIYFGMFYNLWFLTKNKTKQNKTKQNKQTKEKKNTQRTRTTNQAKQ